MTEKVKEKLKLQMWLFGEDKAVAAGWSAQPHGWWGHANPIACKLEASKQSWL